AFRARRATDARGGKADMSNFLVLIVCLVAGVALRRTGRVPEAAPAAINGVILHVSLPALTLVYLHDFHFTASNIGPVLMPWILFAVGAGFFWAAGRWLDLATPTVGALMLVGGFGNTSFVGLPMIESLRGPEGMPLGLLIDQFGSYLALSTVGLLVAAAYSSGGRLTGMQMLRRVATFPPFVALVLAIALMPVTFPDEVKQALHRIGDTLAPLALISVGLQLRIEALREHLRPLCLGLGYKLLVCPALVMLLFLAVDGAPDTPRHVSLIEASMPPMIGAGIVAAQADLAPRLVSMMIGVGIPLGLVTAAAWHWLYCLISI
ncbi:MAG: AEC family transporter, partial [Caldimonas sp.]